MRFTAILFFFLFASAVNIWAETIEITYRWQEPVSGVDQVVYQRLEKTAGQQWADYYYAMYARCKEDISLSRSPRIINQQWIPEEILLDKKKISYQAYLKLIEQSPPGKYEIIYYQKTPRGLLKLGEQPAGAQPFKPGVDFVRTVGSKIGKKSPKTLLYAAGILLPAAFLINRAQEESEVPNVAPTASFILASQTGTLSTDFYFDASSSNDIHEGRSLLKVRWDWESDGVWDTAFSSTKTATHQYTTIGAKTVSMEVKDSTGLLDSTTRTLTVIANGSPLGAGTHPMFRYNQKHVALSPLAGSVTNTMKWNYLTGGQVQSSPAVSANDKILFGSYDGKLYSLNADLTFNWSYLVNGAVYSSPAIAVDGTIYVGGLSGLYALNANGTLKWFYNTGTWMKSSPVIESDGTIYIGGTDGVLYAINPNGSLKWTYTTGDWIESSPALADDGTIYVGSMDNKLYALNPSSTLKWSFTTGGSIVSSPAIAANGTIYVGSYDNKLYALNSDGSQKWVLTTAGPISSSPAIAADGRIIIGSDDGNVYSVNTNGTQYWSYPTGDKVRSSAAIDSTGTIFIGSDDGKLYSLTAAGGLNWTYDTVSPVKSSPAIAHVAGVITNTVLIGSNTNRLYAISEDPALLRITKKANKEQVSVGDIITYQITVANNGTDPSNQTLINDIIPNGFKYVSGSTRLSIQSAAVAIQANPTGDSTLTFNIGTLAVGQTKILSYQLVVGSGVTFGSYENRAVCRYFDVQWKTSNTTRETVEVIPDPLFDLGTIIGKVFEDKNQNGRQDRGEKGVADAKIIMENGTMVKTDNQGRYHIPGVTPGTHLLKLQATTKNSKIVRITEGLLAKVNFGVSKTHDAKPKTQDAQLTLVALGDGELGHSRVSEDRVGSLDQMADNDKRFEDGWYHKGRAAYYLKARMPTTSGSKYIVTSSFDTDRGRHNTSGQSLFRYIDPDKYYLTYGDQSKINYKATDTQGLLYLLAEYKPEEFGQPEASFLWGNYHTSLNKLDLANYQRTLYGAQLRYQAVPVAGHRSSMVGRQPEVTLFTAQAKQRAAHNEFRGTGGSFYYLKHKDVIDGSEKIKFEVRDKITNRPLKTIAQSRGRDYEIDYSNGRIIFKRPVSSVDVFLKAPGEKIVQQLLTSTDILDGHQVYVVVDYEYEPDRRHLNQGNWGGHASQDFGRLLNISPVRVGVTYVTEEDADKDYELKGIDSTVQIVKGTQLYFEYAESTSTGVPQYLSHDGGLNFNNITSGLNPAGSAWSVKTDSQLTPKIKIGSYYKKLDPEFISANTVTEQGTEKYGGDVSYQVSEKITAFASQDIQELDPAANLASRHYLGGHRTRTSIMQGRYLEDRWSLTTEYRYQQVRERLAGVNSATNFNTNVAAARFDYKLAGSVRTFLQQQATLTGETNHQTTTGLSIGLLDIGAAWFQSTFGTKGNSGLVGVESNFGRSIFNIFSNYQVDNRRVGGRSSVFTVGSAVKPDPSLRLYSQQEFRTTPTDNSEGTVLGLDKKILERWQVGTSFEKGRVYNFNNNKTNRYVGSGYVTYHNKNKLRVSSKLEVRFDEGKPADKDQYLIYNSAKYYLNQDITLMGRVNWGRSTNEALEKTEGMFGEYGLSVGYRPVDFDRLNLLAKYTYLADINPVGQGSDSLADHTFISKQRFKIYALEAAYDLTDHFQLVEKYAFKNGQEKVGDRDYTDSDTDLWINRVNYHLSGTKELLKKVAWWQRIDLGVEYRILKQKVADDQKEGWLAETLYKLNQYMRIGVGYNFTDFTDDLRNNNDYSARGPFIRLVATVVY